MFTNMRSNDAFLGLPHDVFAFTMIQEIFARTLGVKLGTYKHAVGSLHLYRKNRKAARQYLKEGWQSTAPMPPMPRGTPWNAIKTVLKAERSIRAGRRIDITGLNLHPYWADLVRLLKIYRHSREGQHTQILKLKTEMANTIFHSYIEDLRHRISYGQTKKA